MGTFLGNLQVLNPGVEEVSALFPKSLVDRWSERFVSVLDEKFQLGTVDRPARKLSKKLPEAVVLSVGLVDSDLLELAVWQNGKRLTARAHFPYDGVSKRGDPKVFCAALDLPPEDEKRLKAVWARGSAEEQLGLTGALLGVQLYADPRCVPEKTAVRDEACVDNWLAQHPDPPKVKNKTRAELIQELNLGVFGYGWDDKGGYLFYPPLEDRWGEEGSGQVWDAGPDGTLVCKIFGGLRTDWYYRSDGERILGFDSGPGGEPRWTLAYDSEGVLPVPLDLGDVEYFFHSAPDGGLTAWRSGRRDCPGEIRRIPPDGTVEVTSLPEHYDQVVAVLGDRAYFVQHVVEQEPEKRSIFVALASGKMGAFWPRRTSLGMPT